MNPYVHPPPSTRIIWLFLHGAFSHTPIPGMDINIVLFIHINSMLTHKTPVHANNISILYFIFWPQILIMIITWVVPGHHEPLPILTRSLRRWCVARPGVEALWLPRTWVITHILVFIHIGHYAYWLSYLVITTHIGYHSYLLSHKGMFSSMGS